MTNALVPDSDNAHIQCRRTLFLVLEMVYSSPLPWRSFLRDDLLWYFVLALHHALQGGQWRGQDEFPLLNSLVPSTSGRLKMRLRRPGESRRSISKPPCDCSLKLGWAGWWGRRDSRGATPPTLDGCLPVLLSSHQRSLRPIGIKSAHSLLELRIRLTRLNSSERSGHSETLQLVDCTLPYLGHYPCPLNSLRRWTLLPGRWFWRSFVTLRPLRRTLL